MDNFQNKMSFFFFIGTLIDYKIVDSTTAAAPSTGLYFTFNGTILLPGDTISISDVGLQPVDRANPGATLVCVTTIVNENCCRKGDTNGVAIGSWLYPNKSAVATPADINNRNNTLVRYVHTRQVRLASVGQPSGPAGEYTCLVPTASGINVSATINIVIPPISPDTGSGDVSLTPSTNPEDTNSPGTSELSTDILAPFSTNTRDTTSPRTSELSTEISPEASELSTKMFPQTSMEQSFGTPKISTETNSSRQIIVHTTTDTYSNASDKPLDGSTNTSLDASGSHSLPLVIIAPSAAGTGGFLLVVVALIALTCLMKKRRGSQKKIIIEHYGLAMPTDTAKNAVQSTGSTLPSPRGFKETKLQEQADLHVLEFSVHIARMKADRDKMFELEYETIEVTDVPDYSVSQLPSNIDKNRFANIYPYNFNRVKLNSHPGVETSDYINASYINGYGRSNVYVAAQGPKEETVMDFWNMILDRSIPTIVMLTKIFEGRKKCEQYWPENINEVLILQTDNDFKVKLDSALPCADYFVRKITVSKGTELSHEVTMFHYLAWPDHGVPANPMSMINFIKRVRKIHPYSNKDLVLVHCSAGVGRTGTFITLDSMLERVKTESAINIHKFVKDLRKQRVMMVQTLTQYIFIHDALDEFLTCGDTEITSMNLRNVIAKLRRSMKSESATGFEQQFQKLNAVTEKAAQAETSHAIRDQNKNHNRYEEKLPYNHTRVRLHPYGPQFSDYINASFVEGYRKTGSYIATQAPLPHTVGSFWRMVWEQKVKCIVMLCNEEENNKVVSSSYWPRKRGVQGLYDNISVTLSRQEVFPEYIVREMLVIKSGSEKASTGNLGLKVFQIQYLKWPEQNVPTVTNSVLEIANLVQKIQISTGNSAITVMCNDGVGRTGTFISIHAQMERIKAEGVVDFFQFIKSIRFQRAGLVSNKVQYEFCHFVLADFLDGFDAYANFKELI